MKDGAMHPSPIPYREVKAETPKERRARWLDAFMLAGRKDDNWTEHALAYNNKRVSGRDPR